MEALYIKKKNVDMSLQHSFQCINYKIPTSLTEIYFRYYALKERIPKQLISALRSNSTLRSQRGVSVYFPKKRSYLVVLMYMEANWSFINNILPDNQTSHLITYAYTNAYF